MSAMRIRLSRFAVLVFILVACSAKDDRVVIAVIPKGTTHEFWKAIHAGALEGREGARTSTSSGRARSKEDDRAEQIKVVEDFVTQGVDGHRARAARRHRRSSAAS